VRKAGWSIEFYLKMKLKLPTMSSRTYSGKHLKASGCCAGRGNLKISEQQRPMAQSHLLDGHSRSISRLGSNSQEPNGDDSHECE
jgi:hypothetical protein